MPDGAWTSRISWSCVPRPKSFAQALDWTAEVYRAAGALMKEAGTLQGVADEGGWWPAFSTNEQALDTLVRAIERAGFTPGQQVGIALDVAASEFGRGGKYKLALEDKELDSDGMIKLLTGWIGRYPIVSIEDPLAEDDDRRVSPPSPTKWADRVQVVGDDFLVTQAARVREAAVRGAANAVLLKPNQRGTLTETFDGLAGGAAGGLRRHRLGPLRRDRGRDDRAPRGRLGRRPAEGRQLRPRRAHGEVERGAAHRGGARRAGAVRRRGVLGRSK